MRADLRHPNGIRVEPARAAAMLAGILEEFREHEVAMTPLAVIAAAVDAGADEELAADILALARERLEQEG